MAAIKALGEDFSRNQTPLHVLINNAGVMVHNKEVSADGLELNFATNTLGSYALTRALEPALKRAAPSRVIFVSSGGALTEKLEVNDLQGDDIRDKKDFGTVQYARDKRRQMALAEQLAEELSTSGVGVYSMHPGWTSTEGVKTAIPGFYSSMKNRLRTLEQGADTIVWLSVRPQSELTPGGFYLDRHVQSKHLPLAGTGYPSHAVNDLVKNLNAMLEKLH
jgi:dehydrogenase/reductase SDR family protein 12